MLDTLIASLAIIISVLLLTGGVHYDVPGLKLEVSQIDPFSWALLLLLGIRKIKTGKWFSDRAEKFLNQIWDDLKANEARVLLTAICIYSILYIWIGTWRYQSFQANAYDLSYTGQSLWATTKVSFLYSTLSKGHTYLGEHFTPLLGVAGYLYGLFDSVYFIFVLQTLLFASGAWLVYRLTQSHTHEKGYAALAGICYLLYHPMRAANAFDFREDTFFIPVFLGVLLMLDRKKWLSFWLLVALSWSIKENAAIFTALIGLLMLARRTRSEKLQGIILVPMSFFIFWIVNSKLTPHFAGGATQTSLVRKLGNLGSSNGEILRVLIAHPDVLLSFVFKAVFQGPVLKYILVVMVPFLFFARFALAAALVASAGLLLNIIMGVPGIGFHYECVLVPFLFYGMAKGLGELHKRGKLTNVAAPSLIVLSFLLFFGRSPVDSIRRLVPNEHHRFVREELSKIYTEASITTQTALHPHLMFRKDAFLFSKDPVTTDYAIYDFTPDLNNYGTPDLAGDLSRLDKTAYDLVLQKERLTIYKRRNRN